VTLPRLLTVMGSGETAPTMVKVHRAVVDRLGPGTAPGVLLDTPFGFQTNAAELSARAVAYFRESVGAELEVAGLRSRSDLEGPGGDTIVARLAAAPFVFAGPGSPTFALRQWRGTLVPPILAEKLELGGAVTFASAAALTLGAVTVPVYEVYKVGEEPKWAEGLDLLRAIGLPVALIPHYDNAEGGTHDTRFCYLGEERLARLEGELPEGTYVLGVDEHTALLVDLDTGHAQVMGRGGVTVRVRGRSARVEAGEHLSLDRVNEIADELAGGHGGVGPTTFGVPPTATPSADAHEQTGDVSPESEGPPLLASIRAHEEEFRKARQNADPVSMVRVVLALDDDLWAWSADTLQSDALDRGRASLRTMVDELGRWAELGARDPAVLVGPFVDLALAMRDAARRERRYADADQVRDKLVELGVAIHDSPEGSTWALVETPIDGPTEGREAKRS